MVIRYLPGDEAGIVMLARETHGAGWDGTTGVSAIMKSLCMQSRP
jgi:hypothetical protein